MRYNYVLQIVTRCGVESHHSRQYKHNNSLQYLYHMLGNICLICLYIVLIELFETKYLKFAFYTLHYTPTSATLLHFSFHNKKSIYSAIRVINELPNNNQLLDIITI